jgi:signal peptidase II
LTEHQPHTTRTVWCDYLYLMLVSGAIIALDQWTKHLVRTHLLLGSDWLPENMAWLLPYARVRYWYNTGAAFGIFQNGNLVFTILAFVVAVAILYYFPRVERDWWLRLALAMQLSGAVGNLIDRLQFQHVIDFISVGTFPIFNVADASITVGAAIMVLGVLINEHRKKQSQGVEEKSNGE